VTDPAETPRRPAHPNRRNHLAFGLFAGLFTAVGLAFLSEYLDNRIKSPEEIKTHLGLPFLAMIPALQKQAVESGALTVTSATVGHDFGEAFRALRTSVLFAFPEAKCRTVVVTSTAPGEGKTSVSVNLALSLSLAGQRVLLIDADMRRPTAHTLIGAPQEPGLSNVIVGNARASESVKQTSTKGLWFLGAGRIPPNPAELLASRRAHDFLRTLRDHFDWIIIDSPPVLAVADSAILAHEASGVLFVVGSEMTERGAARSALDQLDAANATYVGAVLNRVQLARDAYYYARYYRREYSGYYAAQPAAQ
jgi:capsular exopolysaccharide synthesis family protein